MHVGRVGFLIDLTGTLWGASLPIDQVTAATQFRAAARSVAVIAARDRGDHGPVALGVNSKSEGPSHAIAAILRDQYSAAPGGACIVGTIKPIVFPVKKPVIKTSVHKDARVVAGECKRNAVGVAEDISLDNRARSIDLGEVKNRGALGGGVGVEDIARRVAFQVEKGIDIGVARNGAGDGPGVDGARNWTAAQAKVAALEIEQIAGAVGDRQMGLFNGVASGCQSRTAPGHAGIGRIEKVDSTSGVVVCGDSEGARRSIAGEANASLVGVSLNREELDRIGPLVIQPVPTDKINAVIDLSGVVLIATHIGDHGVAVAVDNHARASAELDFSDVRRRGWHCRVEAERGRANRELSRASGADADPVGVSFPASD